MPASQNTADVVIVGGAVVGSAVAFHLARARPALSVVVVERDPGYGACSTARSAGGLRQQFSTPENIRLSQASLAIIREHGWEAEVGFRQRGYLILASEQGLPVLQANLAVQQAERADIVLEDTAELGRHWPWLSVDGLAAGAFGRSNEGWLDAASLMGVLRREARAAGVTYLRGEVREVDVAAGRVRGVQLASGEAIACGTLVNAAGPAAGQVAAMAGIALPVEPRKRFVYVLDCRSAPNGLAQAPLTVDPSGVWFRPEGRTFICGRSPGAADEPADRDLDIIDHGYFESAIWPDLAARVPVFEAVKVINAWAGFYDYNTFDQNGVMGAHPDITNFCFANGFSGHGLQQAPAVGRAIAELIVDGRYVTLDLRRLGFERIVRGVPLEELNVI